MKMSPYYKSFEDEGATWDVVAPDARPKLLAVSGGTELDGTCCKATVR